MLPLEKDVTAGRLKSWLDETVRYLEQAQDITLSAGVGKVCSAIADYRTSFVEAKEAVKIGRCLHTGSSCTFFSELGAARYVYDFALANNLSDVYLEQVAILDDYDQHHKRAELLDTLETYLAHGCCLKETSEILKVHRNTLVQRIERIQSLCSTVNISQSTNHFPLQAAILVYRMRSCGK
jgi:sugar diacid utilization regulator